MITPIPVVCNQAMAQALGKRLGTAAAHRHYPAAILNSDAIHFQVYADAHLLGIPTVTDYCRWVLAIKVDRRYDAPPPAAVGAGFAILEAFEAAYARAYVHTVAALRCDAIPAAYRNRTPGVMLAVAMK